MWKRAVWMEGKKEEEGVIPSNWVKENYVLWPNSLNAEKAFKNRQDPGKNWRTFKLLKVKLTSDNKEACEAVEGTTGAESETNEDSDEEQVKRRKFKRKSFEDFETGSIADLDVELNMDDGQEHSRGSSVGSTSRSRDERSQSPKTPMPSRTPRARSPPRVSRLPRRLLESRSRSPRVRTHAVRSRSGSVAHSRSRSRSARSRVAHSRSHSSEARSTSSSHAARSRKARSRSHTREARSTSRSHAARSRKARSRSHSSEARSTSRSHAARSRKIRSRSHSQEARSTSRSHAARSRVARSRSDSHEARSTSRTHAARSHKARSRSHSRDARSTSRSYAARSRVARSRSRSRTRHTVWSRSHAQQHAVQPTPSRSRSQTRAVPSSKRQQAQVPRIISQPQGRKSVSDCFPMSEAKFQRRVLHLLCEIRDDRRPEVVEDIQQLSSVEGFHCLEEKLEDEEFCLKMQTKLIRVGGISDGDMTKRLMDRLMTTELMCNFNMKGQRINASGKVGFWKSKTCKLITSSVTTAKHTDEVAVQKHIASYLKHAPGRHKRNTTDEVDRPTSNGTAMDG